MAKLSKADLWTLYNVSNELRDYVARPLFSQTELSSESFLPYEINGKNTSGEKDIRDPERTFISHPGAAHHQKIRADIWDLVGKMSHLTVMQPEKLSWICS
jgi:hypothetical protein